MNNDNSSKGLIRKHHEKKDNQNTLVKNYNKSMERNPKAEIDLKLSDYFKLIEKKKVVKVGKNRTKGEKYSNLQEFNNQSNNKSYKSISNKSKTSINKKENKKKFKFGERELIKKVIKNEDLDMNASKDFEIKQVNNINTEDLFNKRLNKNKYTKSKLSSTNNTTIKKKLKNLNRNISCKNFNNYKLKQNFGFDNSNKEIDTNENKEEQKESNHDIAKYLVSSKYFEKVKFNKYKYYNINNNYYADSRRQRIENNLNKILYEKYKVLKPLRMTQRIFYNEENRNKYQNDINVVNNIFYSDNNRNSAKFKNINDFIFNNDLNYNYTDRTNIINKNLKKYYKKIKNISDTRRDLMIEDFFDDIRKEYNLLDFNFIFSYREPNNNCNRKI